MIEVISILLTHFIGDFVLQNRWIALNKSSKFSPWLIHTLIITISLIPCTYFFDFSILLPFCYGIIHGIQDAFIWKVYKHYYSKRLQQINWYDDYWFYTTIGFDQFLHLLSLFILIETLQ